MTRGSPQIHLPYVKIMSKKNKNKEISASYKNKGWFKLINLSSPEIAMVLTAIVVLLLGWHYMSQQESEALAKQHQEELREINELRKTELQGCLSANYDNCSAEIIVTKEGITYIPRVVREHINSFSDF